MPAQASASSSSSRAAPSNLPTTPDKLELTSGGYAAPRKCINTHIDLEVFKRTHAFQTLITFLTELNDSVRGKAVSSNFECSQACTVLDEALVTMEKWVQEIPPVEQPMRYGNTAFRDWHQRFSKGAPELVGGLFTDEQKSGGLPTEIIPYLLASFGDLQRIDYGTGHELAFVMFLCCLRKAGVFKAEDSAALVLKVFVRYLHLTRTLQQTYYLEPAGSKGAWSLDEYVFVAFIFGASQLRGHDLIKPDSVLDSNIVEQNYKDYIYLDCIRFINQMKTGHFGEHSPKLYDITGVPNWRKVNAGLIKMYHDDVLLKFPVAQHFYFGTLLNFEVIENADSSAPPPTSFKPKIDIAPMKIPSKK